MLRNPELMNANYRQTSAQHYSHPMRTEIPAIRQLPIRPECSQPNRPLIPLTDIQRMRSGLPTNLQSLGPVRHSANESGVQLRHSSYPQMRPISGPTSHQNIPLSSRSQRTTSPYDHRQAIPYGSSHMHYTKYLEQRLRGCPPNCSQQSPYPSTERMTFSPQSSTGQPMIRTAYTLEFQKKIVVEPKQSDIREKLKQTRNFANVCENIGLNSREGQECRLPLEPYFQQVFVLTIIQFMTTTIQKSQNHFMFTFNYEFD
jgi:hypothetical protein